MKERFVLKGDICYSAGIDRLETISGGYLVCEDGVSLGAYETLPARYSDFPLYDRGGRLILPGLVDLHVHAPQYLFAGAGMDMRLLEWLETNTFPEEVKYADEDYARAAYGSFARALRRGPNTRACVMATVHLPATRILMDMLEDSGIVTFTGKVNMDRNCPGGLCEKSAGASAGATLEWLRDIGGRYERTRPILSPRFIPACSDELMERLGQLQREYALPVQSHLSENEEEVEWVRRLCPDTGNYGEAYARFGLFGGEAPAVMAHCVFSGAREQELMKKNGVFAAHCPQSNMNLSSGIAPVRRFLDIGVRVGLGSDVAGGCHLSIFRAMADAVMASKLRWRLIDPSEPPLRLEEVFHMGTAGGGAFFGKVGSFLPGFELDALVIDDAELCRRPGDTIKDRLSRVVYLSQDCHIKEKYVRGTRLF